MKILLTVFGVYNTLENVDDEVFKEIIDKIKQVKEINNDDVILISFCDNTENKDVFMYYLRNITDDNEILIGRQYLNNIYYNDIVKSGALLYDRKLSKEQKIFDYTAKLIENNNKVDLYYIDGSINDEYVNDLFNVFGDKVNTNIIKNKDKEIILEIDNKINSVKKIHIKIICLVIDIFFTLYMINKIYCLI